MRTELNFLGLNVDLIYTDTNYRKEVNNHKGIPVLFNEGGLLRCIFSYGAKYERFLERMLTINYKLYKRGYPMDEGEVVFYDAQDDIIKRWKFKDGVIVDYKVVFDPNGSGLLVEMVISPAIQDYGCRVVRNWHETPIEEETYQSPVTEEKQQETICLEYGFYFTNKGEFLERLGDNHKSSFNVFVFSDDLSTNDISTLKSEIRKTNNNEIKFRKVPYKNYQTYSDEIASKVVTTIFKENAVLKQFGINLYNNKVSIPPSYNVPENKQFSKLASAQVFYLGNKYTAIMIDKGVAHYANYFNLVSDLYHELRHKYYNDKGIETYGAGEVWVYIDQIEHSSYRETSDAFKATTESNFRDYLSKAIKARYNGKPYLSEVNHNSLVGRYKSATDKKLVWNASFNKYLEE